MSPFLATGFKRLEDLNLYDLEGRQALSRRSTDRGSCSIELWRRLSPYCPDLDEGSRRVGLLPLCPKQDDSALGTLEHALEHAQQLHEPRVASP